MIELKVGREYYHRIREMEQWCLQEIGQGDWSSRSEFQEDSKELWSISQAFGTTWFRFRRDTDATLFALKWL